MRRLPPDKFAVINLSVEDLPENCSTRFLINRDTSILLVDNPFNPKLSIVTYPSFTPPMHFFYGKADRISVLQQFLNNLQNPADLVVPKSMLHLITNNWPVKFSIPVLFLTAQQGQWYPQQSTIAGVRLLSRDDAPNLKKAFYNHNWLWEFFFSPENLLEQGQAVAAFVDGEIVCAATTLAYTEHYCELGVATRPEFRGKGFALECCRTLSKLQYDQNGRLPCWRTHCDNIASLKIAHQLGLNELESGEKYVFISNYNHVGAYATVAP